jgi:hypothetical protein
VIGEKPAGWRFMVLANRQSLDPDLATGDSSRICQSPITNHQSLAF